MIRRSILVASSVVTGLMLSAGAHSQDPPQPPAAAQSNTMLPTFGLDDLMTMLIQPRHLKLYYAGTQRNWELAAAEARDLRSGLARITDMIPRYLNNPVADAMNSMILPQLKSVDAAISAGNSKQFTTAYAELTAACNACHVYLEHPYIRIRVPEASSRGGFADQNFGAAP